MTLIDAARNRWACKDSDWFVDQFDVRMVERIEDGSSGDWLDDVSIDFAKGKEVSGTDFDFELRFPFVASSKEPSNCADMPR